MSELADHPAIVNGIVTEQNATEGLSERDVVHLADFAPADAPYQLTVERQFGDVHVMTARELLNEDGPFLAGIKKVTLRSTHA